MVSRNANYQLIEDKYLCVYQYFTCYHPFLSHMYPHSRAYQRSCSNFYSTSLHVFTSRDYCQSCDKKLCIIMVSINKTQGVTFGRWFTILQTSKFYFKILSCFIKRTSLWRVYYGKNHHFLALVDSQSKNWDKYFLVETQPQRSQIVTYTLNLFGIN